MKHLVLCYALFTAGMAHAYPDYTCVNACTTAGRPYPECTERCETQLTPAGFKPDRAPDLRCIARCEAAGYAPAFCERKCE